MSESGDYNPGPWRGHDFSSARRAYDVHVGRSYDDAVVARKDPGSLVPKSLKTESESPIVIACDVTGSMGAWPATMFSKLPYLDLEGQEYMGKSMEISFAAVGDAYAGDKYALQVMPFRKGKDLKKSLTDLVIEGGGGGGLRESYDLAALYYSRNVEMPKALNPMFIFIGDEGLYEFVGKDEASKWARSSIEGRMAGADAIRELQQKFSVYLVSKPYHDGFSRNGFSSVDKQIYDSWAGVLGEDHIALLPQAERVVDVIFGLMAKETGRINYFKKELKGRQKPDQVRTVLKSLHTVHELPGVGKLPTPSEGASIMRRSGGTKKSSDLL